MLPRVLILALVLTTGCKKQSEKPTETPPEKSTETPRPTSTESFTSAEYKFKAKFPSTPQQQERTSPLGKSRTFGTQTADGGYVVGVMDLPIPEGEKDSVIQQRLDFGVEMAVNNLKGTNKTSNPITLAGKYPGREFTASIAQPAKGQVRGRAYLVGKRLYTVMAMGTDGYATSSQATEFLNSFQLIE